MKSTYIIANWKSNKTVSEARQWFSQISNDQYSITNTQVVLCPSFPLLSVCKELINKYSLSWKLGAQDISPFPSGKYTGEVNAIQVKEFADYVIVGHSERRQHFGETDDVITQKVKQAISAGLTPILCVQGKDTPVPEGVKIIAYEPIFAIGTGNADTPQDAEDVLSFFKGKGIEIGIYGGSVTGDNIAGFLSQPSIDGVLPGTASLDPSAFSSLIAHA